MKFTSTQENLSRSLGLLASLAGRSTGLPILNNVLLEVQDGALSLSTTNLEIGLKTKVRGKAEKNGSFTVNAKVLADYVSILPSGNVELELIDNQLKVLCGNYQTKLRGQDAEEFPIIPVLNEKDGLQIENQVLKEALEQTVFATSFDEMRPEINGVFFNLSSEQLVLAATDSYRLAEKKVKLNGQIKDNKNIIIPLKTLQEVERVLGSGEDGAVVFLEENQVMIKVGSTLVNSRLIEGDFPDYRQIIPENFQATARLEKEELIQATRAAALFARTGINDINLSFGGQNLKIKTANAQLGEQQTDLKINFKGQPVGVTFNYKYLLDGLQAISGQEVILAINSSSAPVVLRSEQDETYIYLIMPIKQ